MLVKEGPGTAPDDLSPANMGCKTPKGDEKPKKRWGKKIERARIDQGRRNL